MQATDEANPTAHRRRTTIVYVGLLLAFGLGLWAVLSIGGFLRAPPDVHGTWTLVPRRPGTTQPADGAKELPLTIDQSGRFARATVSGAARDLTLKHKTDEGTVTFHGGGWQLTFSLRDHPQTVSITGTGNVDGDYLASRPTAKATGSGH
jgi:hypothetical protein